MTIINPLPFTLQNGTTADASQVQADLDAIRNDVNNNGAGGGGSGNVVGPVSATDGHIAVFDGTTGKIIKDGGAVPGGYRGAVVTKTSDSQTIAASTETKLTFDTAVINTDSVFNAGQPTRLTVPSGVTAVRLIANILYQGATIGSIYILRVYKNATDTYYQEVFLAPLDAAYLTITSAAIPVTAGDYLELTFTNYNGASTVTIPGITGGNFVEMQILG